MKESPVDQYRTTPAASVDELFALFVELSADIDIDVYDLSGADEKRSG